MRIIVSDSSCLIDLRKVALLEAFVRLPFELLIPNTLFEEELLRFTPAEKRLLRSGMTIIDLPGERVLRAQAVQLQLPALSVHDCFAFALAESQPECILLTGDARLQRLAEANRIEAHGVLWAMQQLQAAGLTPPEHLCTALRAMMADPMVRVPHRLIQAQLALWEPLIRRRTQPRARRSQAGSNSDR